MTEILSMKNVTVDRGGRQKLLNIDSLMIQRRELLALVGPNGAGKTTLLQTINLLLPFQGDFRLFGEDVRKSDPVCFRRRSALVFQEPLLLKGTVFENVAWPLRFRGASSRDVDARVYQVLNDFRCEHLAQRLAQRLSGGETQRVCLARALVSEPELLLLDEPFASLDAAMRSSMIDEIRLVAQQKKLCVVLVSHNFSDVLKFADRAVALFDGKILQDDLPENLLRRPADERLAHLVGMDNVLPCRVQDVGGQKFVELSDKIRFLYDGPLSASSRICCLPGDAFVRVEDQKPNPIDRLVFLKGKIERVIPGIGTTPVLVRSDELLLSVRLSGNRRTGTYQKGDPILLAFDPQDTHIL